MKTLNQFIIEALGGDKDYERELKAKESYSKAKDLAKKHGYNLTHEDSLERDSTFTHPEGHILNLRRWTGPYEKIGRLRTAKPRSHGVDFRHSGNSEHAPIGNGTVSKLKPHLEAIHGKK